MKRLTAQDYNELVAKRLGLDQMHPGGDIPSACIRAVAVVIDRLEALEKLCEVRQ